MLENAARLQEIAVVLVRFGFSDLVRRLGMAQVLERAGRLLRWQEADALARLEPPARVCRALESLGPTFVKLGQLLATRIDLFEPAWIAEFSRLQDASPGVPFDALRPQLNAALGAQPETVFAWLDTEPFATGSLAQVHRATLADGSAVVLKVRRPGIVPVIEADLRLLGWIADLAQARLPELRRFQLRAVVRQLARSLRRELDFAAECRQAERIAANFADHPEIVVPRVYWAWSSETLNVQQWIDGIPGRDLAAVDAAGLDRRLLATHGANAVLKMILEDGLFHADPHPGNVFYLPGNRIALIDFGMIGRLSELRRRQLAVLLQGLAVREPSLVADVLLEWAGDSSGADASGLVARIDAFIDAWHGVPLRDLDISALLLEALAILREEDLPLPPDLVLLVKALITLEGLGRALDPGFDMANAAVPFVARAVQAQVAPAELLRRGRRTALRTARLVDSLPTDISRILRIIRRGRIGLDLNVAPLDRFGERFDRAVSRLTVGIVVAALIVGSSLVVSREGGFGPDWPSFGLLAFVLAVAGGLWLLGSIWHGGRRESSDRKRDRADDREG